MDCYYNINKQLSESEHKYREQLVDLCKSIIDRYDESCQEEDDDNTQDNDEEEYDNTSWDMQAR